MNFTSEPFSDPDPPPLPRYRRRNKFLPSFNDAARSKLVENLANRVSPSFDFFLFALLSGAVTGLAFLFESYPLLTLAALCAPIMSPVIGLSLASSIGSVRFFFLSIAGTFVGILLVFVVGVIAGIASSLFPAASVLYSTFFSSITWDTYLILLLGVFLTTLSLAKSEQKPVLPSAAVAYVIFSTAGGIGFHLGKGDLVNALNGGTSLALYLLTTTIIGALIFLAFGFRPRSVAGYLLLLGVLISTILLVLTIKPFSKSFLPDNISPESSISAISATSSQISSSYAPPVQTTETPTPSNTPTQTATATITVTPTLTLSPTITFTPGPTPVWVYVDADGQSGARLRENPGFGSKVIRIIDNGILVKLLQGVEFKDKVYWAHVETIDGTIGWMVYTVLATPTPSASYTPTVE